jgi:hypothetical protein
MVPDQLYHCAVWGARIGDLVFVHCLDGLLFHDNAANCGENQQIGACRYPK